MWNCFEELCNRPQLREVVTVPTPTAGHLPSGFHAGAQSRRIELPKQTGDQEIQLCGVSRTAMDNDTVGSQA